MLSNLTVAATGALIILLAGGASIGTSAAIATGDGPIAIEVVGASAAYFPAVAILIGFSAVLIGFWPRFTPATWLALAASLVLTILGPLLALPEWAEQLSPFTHIPLLPAETFKPEPLLIELMVAITLATAGLLGISRRDLA